MQPDLHARFASERLKDDHDGLQPEDDGTATLEPETITIRPLQEGDATAVELLAQLDERPVPRGPLLLAVVEGSIEAAIGVETRETAQTRSRGVPAPSRSCTSARRSCARPSLGAAGRPRSPTPCRTRTARRGRPRRASR